MHLQDFTQPEENVRFIEIGKNKLFMKREDPYGFISINYERGDVPEELKGTYTSFDEARKRIQRYLEKKQEVVEKQEQKALKACKKLGINPDDKLNDGA